MERTERFVCRSSLAAGAVAMAFLIWLTACEVGILDESRPLAVEIELLAGNLEVGQELSFQAEATGSQLGLLVIRFGDGAADSLAGRGAQTMRHRVEHTYGEPGTYRVQATVLELAGNNLTDELTIEILGDGPASGSED